MANEKPTGAFLFSLIGGAFVLLGGLVVTVAMGGWDPMGPVGVLWGVLMIASAVKLNSNPDKHRAYGALIVVLSLVSWYGSIGGLVLGFIFGLPGGILAITWTPPAQRTRERGW